MKNRISKISIIFILIMISFINNFSFAAKGDVPSVDKSKKIYDYANLLSADEEKEIYNEIISFTETYNLDMAIVTINENPLKSAMKYSDDFYDYNGFGLDSQKSGILFLMDMDTREMWISTTGSAIKLYNDNRIQSILDLTYNKIVKKDYSNCAKEFIRGSEYFAKKGNKGGDSILGIGQKLLFVLVAPTIITIIYISIGLSKNKNVRIQSSARHYITKDINITETSDIFLHKHTTHYTSSSSSSGGGSSTHSSSSGSSHGGGGRSF